jgi:membrane fusion protein (multidrug efflux system)
MAPGFIPQQPRTRRILLAALICVPLVVAAVWWYLSGRETTDDAQIDGHITPIAARVGGTVLGVHVQDNESVEAGAVLFEIDPRDYQVALMRAQAELADAEASLEAARAGVPITTTSTSGQLRSAGASVERAEAGVAVAASDAEAAGARRRAAEARLREATAVQTRWSRDLDRMKQLVAKDEVSQQQFDAAVAAAEASHATVDSARAGVAEAEKAVAAAEDRRTQAQGVLTQAQADLRTAKTAPEQVTITRSRQRSAEARVQLARAALEQATLNLAYTTVKAPGDGYVSKKSVEPGQVVQAGQPLLALVSLGDVWVTANFKENEVRRMRPGQAVVVKVDANGRSYRGHVDSLAAATGARFSLLPPENATGNYVKVVQRVPVKIVLESGQDPKHVLRPGMSVVPTVYIR